MRSYRIEVTTRKWMRSKQSLPPTLRKLVEVWVEMHEEELLEQWERAMNNQPVVIVG